MRFIWCVLLMLAVTPSRAEAQTDCGSTTANGIEYFFDDCFCRRGATGDQERITNFSPGPSTQWNEVQACEPRPDIDVPVHTQGWPLEPFGASGPTQIPQGTWVRKTVCTSREDPFGGRQRCCVTGLIDGKWHIVPDVAGICQ